MRENFHKEIPTLALTPYILKERSENNLILIQIGKRKVHEKIENLCFVDIG
jgi:hypothetical protein